MQRYSTLTFKNLIPKDIQKTIGLSTSAAPHWQMIHLTKWSGKTSAGCIGMAGLLPFKILDGWANLSCFDRITSWWYITAEYDNGHDSDDGNDWDYDDAAAADDDDDDDDNHRHLPPCHLRWPFPCETTWSPSDFMEMSSISERW